MTMGAIEEAKAAGGGIRIRPSYGYYRQPNGWITVSPASDLDELHYTRRGWTRLSRYGRIEMSAEYAADHPLEALLMLGGAKELSREQIIESGLHLNPPLIPSCKTPLSQAHPRHTHGCMDGAKPAHFPQINKTDLIPYPCTFCERVLPTKEALDQHESVAHKEEKGEIRGGQAIADALIRGFGGTAPAVTQPDILSVLSKVGLNKTQRAALAAAGVILEGNVEEEAPNEADPPGEAEPDEALPD